MPTQLSLNFSLLFFYVLDLSQLLLQIFPLKTLLQNLVLQGCLLQLQLELLSLQG